MAKITISCRRTDSQAIIGRIVDRLVEHYGKEAIFRVIGDIPPGIDLRQYINETLPKTTIMLAIIGPDWLGMESGGLERINEESDPVRVELETASRRGVVIIPVLIGNTRMPDFEQLPPSLAGLAFRDAMKVDTGRDFDYHMDRLIKSMDAILDKSRISGSPTGATATSSAPASAPAPSDAIQNHMTESRPATVIAALPIAALTRRRHQLGRLAGNSDDSMSSEPAHSSRPRLQYPTEAPDAGSSVAASRPTPPPKSGAGPPGLAILLGVTAALAVAGYVWRQELALAAGAILKMLGLASIPPMPVAKSEEEGDLVDASIFAPASGRAGEAILVQVFLHALEAAQSAADLAIQADSSAKRRGLTTLDVNIKRGQRVDIVLDAPGLTIDEPEQFLNWRGEPRSCQFVVMIPADRGGRTFQIKARLLVDSIPVGSLRFTLRATGLEATAPIDLVGEVAHRYRRAFLSHSHDDRVKVLTYAQLLEAAGIKYFQDIASLRVMDNWEPRLHEAIEQCDLFLLFWTASAARSEWVERETRYALARQTESGRDMPDVMPIFLEPDAPRPPEWLKSRHFDSLLRLAMRGAAAEAGPKSI